MTAQAFDDRPPHFDELLEARERIHPYAVLTPVLQSDELDRLAGCRLLFKCENLQRGGAFKFRGACNAVMSLQAEEAVRGVLTQSSGNHGAAVALACRLRDIPAIVVLPHSAPQIKLDAIRRHGAEVVACGVSQAARDAATASELERRRAAYVHPFNDRRVIAGQATATLELLDHGDAIGARPTVLVAPVSGGGLLSGTALAAHGIDPAIRVIGAEPEGAADAHASLESGERVTGQVADTLCDGLRAELGPLTFEILRAHAERILLASDTETVAAMRLIWETLKLVVEPSAAVALAAILRNTELFAGHTVGVILSGGNLDLDWLPWQVDPIATAVDA
jgi:threonine dehydratase